MATLSADSLELELETGAVRGRNVRLSSCGNCPPPWTLGARRAAFRPGGDVDLVGAVLRLGRVPVFALPWLRVRTARRWGLLLPRLGWRSWGGFEIGQGLWVPLGSRAELSTHAAYLTGLVGAEVDVALRSDAAEIRAVGQVGANGSSATIAGRGHGRRDATTAAFDLAWTLDPDLARELSPSPEAEARRYEVSTVGLVHAAHAFQAGLTAELVHDLAEPDDLAGSGYYPFAELQLHLLPVRLGPLWLGLRQATQLRWYPGLAAERAPWPRWHTALEPELVAARAVGPFAARVGLSSLHAAWESPRPEATVGRNRVVASADVALPLVKSTGSGRAERRHLIEPALRYRIALSDTLAGSDAIFEATDPVAWPVAGHILWLQLRSALDNPRTGRGFRVVLGQLLSFAELAGEPVRPRLEARIEVDMELARLRWSASLDELSTTLGEAWSDLRMGHQNGHGLALGWHWLSVASASQCGPDLIATVPTLVPWTALGSGHALTGRVWTTLFRVLRITAGARLDLQSRSLIRVGGSLTYTHRCGCLDAGLGVWHRPDRPMPDIMLTANIGGIGRH